MLLPEIIFCFYHVLILINAIQYDNNTIYYPRIVNPSIQPCLIQPLNLFRNKTTNKVFFFLSFPPSIAAHEDF